MDMEFKFFTILRLYLVPLIVNNKRVIRIQFSSSSGEMKHLSVPIL